MVIFLQFTAFDIGYHPIFCANCSCDHLTITDGDGTTLMEKSCGSSLPANITSATNAIELIFSSDHFDSGNSGWSANWSAVTPGGGRQSFDCFSLLESNHLKINSLCVLYFHQIRLCCFSSFHFTFLSSLALLIFSQQVQMAKQRQPNGSQRLDVN